MFTTLEARVSRVVDGDTIRIIRPGESRDEALRILSLDTEESHATSSKPVTPLGMRATEEAKRFFEPGDTVRLEFPGSEPLEQALVRHRGNFGRLLVHVFKGELDFQAHMIREGLSPYFTKYGRANNPTLDARYRAAEREAQAARRGVWDQLSHNGAVVNNYAALGAWWSLRAAVIDSYRAITPRADLVNSRLDNEEIRVKAERGDPAVVFTALERVQRLGSGAAKVEIGSVHQRFTLFIRDFTSVEGQRVVNLLEQRYLSRGSAHPRRSYCYVRGDLKLYRGNPEIEVTSIDQIHDEDPGPPSTWR